MRWVLKDEQEEEKDIPGKGINVNKTMQKTWQIGEKEGIGRGTKQWETRLWGCLKPEETGLHPLW